MRSVHFTAVTFAAGLIVTATSATAGVEIRSASESNGRIVAEITNPTPITSYSATFMVAISTTGTYTAQFHVGPARPEGQSAASLDTLLVWPPFPFRGGRVLWLRASIPQGIPVSHVTIDFTPAATVHDAATVDPLLKATVINTQVFPVEPRTGSPDPWFSLSPNWVKLTVNSRAIHSVTGSDLATAGVALDGIDPATVRVYTLGAHGQPRLFTDPAGTWRRGNAMREVAIRVEAGGDGTFDPGDRVLFYGLATEDWEDLYGAAPDTVYHRHGRARTNVYFLTWGGALPGQPARMADVSSPPIAGPERTSYRHREYRERDLIAEFDYRGDGWLWLDIPRPGAVTYTLSSIDVRDLVSTRPQIFRSVGLAPYVSPLDTTASNVGHHVVFIDTRAGQTVQVGGHIWDSDVGDRFYEDGVPIRITSNFLAEGTNVFSLRLPGDLNAQDKMLFAWFSLAYERRIRAYGDAAAFSSPDTVGTLNLRADGFGASGTLYAFDVTDPWSPFALTGFEVTTPGGGSRRVRFSSSVASGRRHYWVSAGGSFAKPGVARVTPADLRDEPAGPNMLIVCHPSFRGAAEILRAHRSSRLPLYANPVVTVVTTDDIFDNFSGGLPDPIAIRNYIKFLYDNSVDSNGNPRLGYVLLLGNANEDFRNNASPLPDLVPSNLYFTRSTLFAFSTDEWLGHLDPSDQTPGRGILDVALGRLPAESAGEALTAVNKIIGYELDAPREPWGGEVVLVADDELSSFKGACETQWTFESETLAYRHTPDFMSVHKVYLTEYPELVSVKPESRLDFLSLWNAGALLINYIGHGSGEQMADEQVFLASDVSLLNNGLRLPVLMAFSCTIGDFANPTGKSLSEKLLFRDVGGVVATVTASREAYPNPNEKLNYALFDRMFPARLDAPIPALGVGLLQAKNSSLAEVGYLDFQEENTWKYNLLGDPAMTLRLPQREIRFETGPADTLIAGARGELRGTVLKDGIPDTGFNGTVDVTVREPSTRRTYITRCTAPIPMYYVVHGGVMYRGTADVRDGEFEVSFRVPRYATTGPLAFASAYASAGTIDAGAVIDSVLEVVAPTLADSLALRAIDGPPRVDLGFKSGSATVKPGDTVRAFVRDQDGINILSTTNEGKQAVLLDNIPVPIDVNEFFTFDHGGVDTSGVLLYPLPDLPVGDHRLVYKVSDSFGSTTLDTLRFAVTDARDFFAEAVLNYPNPFETSTQFLFRMSDRAAIELEIFTVSGKRVRRLEEVREGGQVWIEWDGRDASGGDLANGTYLYVATVDFVGLDRAPVVLRGKVSKIR